ncbi:hypothetical protein V5O48_013407 [Marasmius crinis-equi]|uniref:Uncharacterized protein n=1 Tax=Marasmius crinis-equi TaxID=585013 RepID=A0ABR3F0A4_9AGAR
MPNRSISIPSVIPPRPPTPPPPGPETPIPSPSPSPPLPSPPPEPAQIITEPDEFGLYRVYSKYPTRIPDEEIEDEEVCEGAGYQAKLTSNPLSVFGLADPDSEGIFAPFLNATVFRLMNWFYGPSNNKSIAGLDSLVHDVILADDFDREDLRGFRTQRELSRLDDYANPRSNLRAKDGWIEGSVKIRLPAEGVEQKEEEAPEFTIPDFFYRKPLELVKSALQSQASNKFHCAPFKLFWQPPSSDPSQPPPPPTRIVSEIYNSDAFINEYEKIQTQEYHNPRPQPEASNPEALPVENVIAALLWWSDSTHLASFGNASLWPLYLFFGNQSKYDRAKPTSFSAHHAAYIPDLPDNIQEFYQEQFGFSASAATLTHLKRELMHAVWALLLDDEFMHAYKHGILIQCADGVIRRVFPRFFTYSADYPEKVLLASIRNLGHCPCPHCFVEKDQIPELGTVRDCQRRERKPRVDTEERRGVIERVRSWIFGKGYAVGSAAVEAALQLKSWVPTRNTFSECLSSFGANFYELFVPDILHEFELGVWKATFTHLLRILCCLGGNSIQQLNARMVPTFGRDTIRKFSVNVSAMKQLAARDFEDLLQCSIPVFEGLIPSHNSIILDLLYDLCTWHAYAKLRIHSETSLADMDSATTSLGKSLRKFANNVCPAYDTKELPKETAARGCRKAALAKKPVTKSQSKRKRASTSSSASPKVKAFNLNTYKLHALGHYVHFIRLFGTTDNYSTQIGELEHRRVKRFYARTNKSKFVKQTTHHERREQIIRGVETKVLKGTQPAKTLEPPPVASLNTHHFISADRSDWFNVREWTRKLGDDPAIKDFLPKLKDHLLSAILNQRDDTFSDEECAKVNILNDRIYHHKVLDVQYTSYDMRRCQDSINLGNHSDIMVLADEKDPDSHPYWYARVLGIFHARVYYKGDGLTRNITFLWVRWFGLDTDYTFGPARKRLPRVGWIDGQEPGAFGFLSPQYVLRASHLVPAFALGKRTDLLPPSIARRAVEKDSDWDRHYVCIFVDRDMVSRYISGIAIGHTAHLPECHQVPHEEPEGEPLEESELSDVEEAVIEVGDEVGVGEDEDDADEDELDDYGYRDSEDESEDAADHEEPAETAPDMYTDVLRSEGYSHL